MITPPAYDADLGSAWVVFLVFIAFVLIARLSERRDQK